MSKYSLMVRPARITDSQILVAARDVFLEKGISATTAEVARRAGIAEGSIFKRFPTKEHLFCAAMTPGGDPPWLKLILSRTNALYPTRVDAETAAGARARTSRARGREPSRDSAMRTL